MKGGWSSAAAMLNLALSVLWMPQKKCAVAKRTTAIGWKNCRSCPRVSWFSGWRLLKAFCNAARRNAAYLELSKDILTNENEKHLRLLRALFNFFFAKNSTAYHCQAKLCKNIGSLKPPITLPILYALYSERRWLKSTWNQFESYYSGTIHDISRVTWKGAKS